MSRTPRPLGSPFAARATLAHRLASRADRIRQIATGIGVRPYRCFLTWTKYTGEERGEGKERLMARLEILPTPRVSDLTAVNYRQWSIGAVPEGSIRLDRVSCAAYTEDALRGLELPYAPRDAQPPAPGGQWATHGPDFSVQFADDVDFFYEVVEDGRGDPLPVRRRFKLLGGPFRQAGNVEWVILLQRADKDETRRGLPPLLNPPSNG